MDTEPCEACRQTGYYINPDTNEVDMSKECKECDGRGYFLKK